MDYIKYLIGLFVSSVVLVLGFVIFGMVEICINPKNSSI